MSVPFPAVYERDRNVRAVISVAAAVIASVMLVVAAHGQTSDSSRGPTPTPSQPSPQGNTGPLTTGSGGTDAASPQGETPPRMQADPKK